MEEAVWGVLGEELDLDDTEDASSPSAPSDVSMTTAGSGCDAAESWRAMGRDFRPELASGGGDTLTSGEESERLPLKTELLTPLRRQETAASDLEGVAVGIEPVIGVPRGVPPLITVVKFGVNYAIFKI